MAISLEQLEGYLLQEDLMYAIDDERIMLSFGMDDYVSPVSGTQYVVITLPADAKLEIAHGDETIEEAAAGDGGFVIAFRLSSTD